jgi:hypothetical protein
VSRNSGVSLPRIRASSRERRNESPYAAAFVPETSLADAREATTELLERARALLGGGEVEHE